MRLVITVLIVGCTTAQPAASIHWAGLDTLRGPLHVTSTRCPQSTTILVEGVADSLGVLLVLPNDSAITHLVDRTRVRAVISRVLPARIDSWRADSGTVTVAFVDGHVTGSFDVWLPDARVNGRFSPLELRPDTMACEVRDSSGVV